MVLDDKIKYSRAWSYKNITDPLLNEARIKRLLGEDATALLLEEEALRLRTLIQESYPSPFIEV